MESSESRHRSGFRRVPLLAAGPAAALVAPNRALAEQLPARCKARNLAAPFSGPKPGPAFSGEHFLRNLPAGVTGPVNLSDGNSMVVVTVEPDLAGKDPTGAAPFSIKPLVAEVASGAGDRRSIRLHRDLSTVPSGTARF